MWIATGITSVSDAAGASASSRSKVYTLGRDPDLFSRDEWPLTDFSNRSVSFNGFVSGGPRRDGIRAIDAPQFTSAHGDYPIQLGENEPVISFALNGDARAYPLRILMRHEIVNDVVGDVPVLVTYCPLCNAAVVFDARLDGEALTFGTTGRLRKSDLVMYDRKTETWWQQFTGEALIGEYAGRTLRMLAARIESIQKFRERYPHGLALLPLYRASAYINPYEGYDGRSRPYLLYRGRMPDNIEPMARVVSVGGRAWSLALLTDRRQIESDDLRLTWAPGQNSALDEEDISRGRDIGNVVVQRRNGDVWADAVYDVTFAFAFHAFYPEGEIITTIEPDS